MTAYSVFRTDFIHLYLDWQQLFNGWAVYEAVYTDRAYHLVLNLPKNVRYAPFELYENATYLGKPIVRMFYRTFNPTQFTLWIVTEQG